MTAKVEDSDKIKEFAKGADDYIVKPFSIDELGARVSAHLRREQRQRGLAKVRFDDKTAIDYTKRSLYYNDKIVPLSKKNFTSLNFCLSIQDRFSAKNAYTSSFGITTVRETAALLQSTSVAFAASLQIKEQSHMLKQYGELDINGQSKTFV